MQKIKLEAENDLEKRCKNLKEQNEALISGLDLANETIIYTVCFENTVNRKKSF